VRFFAALMGQGCQSGQGADFAAIVEGPPGEELHHIEPGTVDADASQLQQLAYLFYIGLGASPYGVLAFFFQGFDLFFYQLKTLKLKKQTSLQAGG
jgi:hypothetical protein